MLKQSKEWTNQGTYHFGTSTRVAESECDGVAHNNGLSIAFVITHLLSPSQLLLECWFLLMPLSHRGWSALPRPVVLRPRISFVRSSTIENVSPPLRYKKHLLSITRLSLVPWKIHTAQLDKHNDDELKRDEQIGVASQASAVCGLLAQPIRFPH